MLNNVRNGFHAFRVRAFQTCQRPLPKHRWQRGLVVFTASGAVVASLYAADYAFTNWWYYTPKRSESKKLTVQTMSEDIKSEEMKPEAPTKLQIAQRDFKLSEFWQSDMENELRWMVGSTFVLALFTLRSFKRLQRQIALCNYAKAGVFVTFWSGVTIYSSIICVDDVNRWNRYDKRTRRDKHCLELLLKS